MELAPEPIRSREMADDPHSVCGVLKRFRELGEKAGEDKVKLGDAVQAMGHRAYGPFFIVFPLIDISPVGGIPGLPTAMALVMVLLAQLFRSPSAARRLPWSMLSFAATGGPLVWCPVLTENGAAYRTRTCDPRITNAMLYQLS